jgi:ABC-type sulfate/molybdate transport systems ATPase subunit
MPDLSVRVRHRASAFELDIDFEAPPGVTILFGPSGSGKSTTLAAIAGLLRPKEGRIALGDEVWLDAKTHRPVHLRNVAFVFQSLALFPHMTARANVAYGMNGDDKGRRALQLLERMRVGHVADRKPRTFSGGEAQRVALARAMAMKPRVVLLDEPFSALDRGLRRDLLTEVKTMAEDLKVPVLHVTHHPREARALGDRVLLFERGKIVGRGGIELLPEDE